MNLDEAQRKKVSDWIGEGAKLSEIQTRIGKEFGISMTYMDVRFLIDDLKLKPKDAPSAAPVNIAPPKESVGTTPANSPAATVGAPLPEGQTGGAVSVTVDQIARPGSVVSGRVKFSDGQGGAWLIDQMGRPGLIPDQQGYRPAPADIANFQAQLQNELARLGF
ncbi:MAG TPA: hypothetical protein VNT99_01890 [Methylomirabilota bacterium]|nr:hypothetical protein [Methylomirabilota bacterium]